MPRGIVLFCVAAVALLPTAGAAPAMSLQRLQLSADFVLHGKVVAVDTDVVRDPHKTDDHIDHHHNITVDVLRTVKRDEGFGRWWAPRLTLSAWEAKDRPASWDGPRGHRNLPLKVGDEAVFFGLAHSFGKGDARRWRLQIFEPNGALDVAVLAKLPDKIFHSSHVPHDERTHESPTEFAAPDEL